MMTAVVLLNLGGPQSLDEVEPFLTELFIDVLPQRIPYWLRRRFGRCLARYRAPLSRTYYENIGGGSPLVSITQAQAKGLETALGGGSKVEVLMRFTAPRAVELVPRLVRTGVSRIVLLPLYPQFSRATTGSSLREIARLQSSSPNFPKVECIMPWFSCEEYLKFFVCWIEEFLVRECLEKGSVHFLFSAHSLPERWISAGDPYLIQTKTTVSAIASRLGLERGHFSLGFQSRLGRSGRWLGPSTADCLESLAKSWGKVLVIPMSFVSDHVETLYELDIFLKNHASQKGLQSYYRLPMFNSSPSFIKVLSYLCQHWPREKLK